MRAGELRGKQQATAVGGAPLPCEDHRLRRHQDSPTGLKTHAMPLVVQ